jgi:hypothetical protein
MDIDVLCDVETFKIKARFIEVESMPQHFETQKEIIDADKKIIWKVQLQQLEANKITWFSHHCITNVWVFFFVNNNLEKIMVGSS